MEHFRKTALLLAATALTTTVRAQKILNGDMNHLWHG